MPEDMKGPGQVVAEWTSASWLVEDEARRLINMTQEREPGTTRAKYLTADGFRLPLPVNADSAFMEKVADKIREQGWPVMVTDLPMMGGRHRSILLGNRELVQMIFIRRPR